MEETPVISVIIPAYGCAATLPQALDSALVQNVPLEVLVIDDCSPDHLEAVLAPYLTDPRVRSEKNEKNMGVAATRNRGVRLAKGRYIAFLDADDYWLPGKLCRQVEEMEATGCVLCATARELMTPEGVCTGRILPIPETITYHTILTHNCISCSSVLILREVALEFPMHDPQCHEDYILWMEVLRAYPAARGINEPLLKYRLSSTGKSGSKLHSARMTYRSYRCAGLSALQAACCFCSYAVHGLWKYSTARLVRRT